jgi:hypothetical protein
MPRKKADTTISQLFNRIKSDKTLDPQIAINLINALEKTIPVIKRRTKMPKIDPNLNRRFLIKRINYEITADIIEFNPDINSYCMKVLSVIGESKVCPGVFLFISKRELELTGRRLA